MCVYIHVQDVLHRSKKLVFQALIYGTSVKNPYIACSGKCIELTMKIYRLSRPSIH